MNLKFTIPTCLFLIFASLISNSQNITLYLIPGMGTDSRILEDFDFGEQVNVVLITWPEHAVELDGLGGLAKSIATQIDTTQSFILLGVSMGGMIAMELATLVKPEAVILVSSIKSGKELPFKFKLGRIIPAYKLLTKKRLVKIAENPKTWENVKSEKLRKLYPEMLKSCGVDFLKWQMRSIVNWKFDSAQVAVPVFHIHGEKDDVLYLKHTTADVVIPNKTHRMIANGREEIQNEVRKYLSSKKF